MSPSSGFRIRRGTSISHLFIDATAPGADRRSYFARNDIRYMLHLGLDHVRISIAEELMWTEAGKIRDDMFVLLDEKVSLAISEGLRVVLCLHQLRSHPRSGQKGIPRQAEHIYSNPARSTIPERTDSQTPALFTSDSEMERFGEYWQDLSDLLSPYPTSHLAYDLFNEPVAPRDDDWNRVIHHVFAVLRKREKNRMLIVGSNLWQIPETIKRLDLPVNDRNILLSFHLYYPMLVTHHRASWMPWGAYSGRLRYPGTPVPREELEKCSPELKMLIGYNNQPITKQVLRKIVTDAAVAGASLGHRVCCGEFGCMDTVPIDLRNAWFRDFVEILDDQNIPWTQWDWKGRFGILDNDTWKPVGIETALGLEKPKWIRPPRPRHSQTLWQRIRRRIRALGETLKVLP